MDHENYLLQEVNAIKSKFHAICVARVNFNKLVKSGYRVSVQNSRDTIIKDFNILKQTLMLEIRAICCQSCQGFIL